MKHYLLLILACICLASLLLSGCATPVTTAQPQKTPPALAAPVVRAVPTATPDPFVLNVCHTCDVQQRRMQATVTR